MRLNLITLISYAMVVGLNAQKTDSLTFALPDVQITATRIPTPLAAIPASISARDLEEALGLQRISLQEMMAGLPGVFNQNAMNYAQDLRIALRGFGARSAFGIRGIKLIVDDIPESTPDGQGQVDNLHLGLLGSVEVLRGPSSGLYGNASGGVIQLKSREFTNKSFAEIAGSVGSFATRTLRGTAGVVLNATMLEFSGSTFHTDGYRNFSGSKSHIFSLRTKSRLSQTTTLKIGASYLTGPEARDPGSLNLEDVSEGRKQARIQNVALNAGEEVDHLKIFATLDWQPAKGESKSLLYYHNRQFDGRLPFQGGGVIELSRNFWGHTSHYSATQEGEVIINKLILGYDLQFQRDDRARFNNLLGRTGEPTLHQDEKFDNLALFAQDQLRIRSRLLLQADLRFDHMHVAVQDKFLVDGDNSSTTTYNQLNFAIGGSYLVWGTVHPYFRIASSFETPTLSELSANPEGGGFNTELNPSQAMNYEIGLRGTVFSQLDLQGSLFYINSTNEVLPFELPGFPGRDFFRNAGRTERTGLEIALAYGSSDWIDASLSYAYSNFQFAEYILDQEDLKGNRLPGIPTNMLSIEIGVHLPSQITIVSNSQLIGRLYASDTNEVEVNDYFKSDLRFNKSFALSKMSLDLFLGVNNIFGTEYFDNIRVNAFGDRFYEAAPKAAFYGGCTVRI